VSAIEPTYVEPDGVARAEAEQARLKKASVLGIATNLSSQGVLFVLRFAYQIAIARLLLPADFGLVALTAPVIAFVAMFADLGLSAATVQQKEIDQAQLSFLFWANVAASVLLAGVCVAIGPLVAGFYGDDRVAGVMTALGGLIFMGGWFTQHMALLNRHMRFQSIALANVLSFVVGSAAGLVSALLGASYWAIVINQAATSLTTMVFVWAATRWMPGRPGPFNKMKPLLHFGGNITGFNIVNFFSRTSANILLGRFAGEAALGLYDRAYKLVLLPFNQIAGPFGAVVVPLLSRSQGEPDFYRRAYQRMLETVLLLTYPGLVFMIVNSQDLIGLALGPRWEGVAPIFAILGMDAFVAPVSSSMGWLFVSQGRTREMRDYGVLSSIIFVACFVAGLPWGPQGVAAGYVVAGVIEISFLTRVGTRRGPLRGRDLAQSLAPFALGVGVTFAASYGLQQILPSGPMSLLLQSLCAYAVFAGTLATLPRGRRVLGHLAHQLRGLAARIHPPKNAEPQI